MTIRKSQGSKDEHVHDLLGHDFHSLRKGLVHAPLRGHGPGQCDGALTHIYHMRPTTRQTPNTWAHKQVFMLVSRCSCRAVAPVFHRLASWERPQSSWEGAPMMMTVRSVDHELDTQEDVGDVFADCLTTSFLTRKLSAKTVFEIAWHAHNAGVQSRVTELMYKPRASTRNYAQHVKRALGLDHDTESLCTVRMPAQDKYDQNRAVMDFPVVAAHEALYREFAFQGTHDQNGKCSKDEQEEDAATVLKLLRRALFRTSRSFRFFGADGTTSTGFRIGVAGPSGTIQAEAQGCV